ncbi:MAG: helix-turn-helix domain-containing protein [Pseudomonadota bacterium]
MTISQGQNPFDTMDYLVDCAKRAGATGIAASRFFDFDQQAEQLSGFGQEYLQLSPGAFEGRFLSVEFGREVSLHVEYANRSLAQSMTAPTNLVSLGFVLGSTPYRANGETLDHEGVLLVPPGAELHFHSPEGASIVALCVSTEVLEATGLFADITCFSTGKPAVVIDAPNFVARARQDIVDSLRRASVHPKPEVLGRILAASLLTNLRVEMALRTDMSATSAQTRKLENFVRTIDLFKSQTHEPMTYDLLTACTGASRRSLQSSFRDVVGCGPFEYRRQMRLCAARGKIANRGEMRHTIADIAAEVGFFDLSHFSRAYRRLFSESPSQTRHRFTLGARPDDLSVFPK